MHADRKAIMMHSRKYTRLTFNIDDILSSSKPADRMRPSPCCSPEYHLGSSQVVPDVTSPIYSDNYEHRSMAEMHGRQSPFLWSSAKTISPLSPSPRKRDFTRGFSNDEPAFYEDSYGSFRKYGKVQRYSSIYDVSRCQDEKKIVVAETDKQGEIHCFQRSASTEPAYHSDQGHGSSPLPPVLCRAKSDNPQTNSGRFRPPPFFETVESLRQRLYELGDRVYDVDEPPSHKPTLKLWRAMEKHKVSYSLQHYFFVASLSKRCFDVIREIVTKVRRGEITGSRENEVNQSYFNFLYGREDSERFRLLCLLRDGVINTKDIQKVKDIKSSERDGVQGSPECKTCCGQLQQLKLENEVLKKQIVELQKTDMQSVEKPTGSKRRKSLLPKGVGLVRV